MFEKASRLKLISILNDNQEDVEFRKEVLKNPIDTFKKYGVEVPSEVNIKLLENSKKVYNFIIPSEMIEESQKVKELSARPSLVEVSLFVITQIQFSGELKEELLSDAAGVLLGLGVNIPDELEVKIYQNTETNIHFILERQIGDKELSDMDVEAISGGKGFVTTNVAIVAEGVVASVSASVAAVAAT